MKSELEEIIEKAIIEIEEMQVEDKDAINIRKNLVEIEQYLVRLSYKIDAKKQEEIDLLKSVDERLTKIYNQNAKWKIFYLIGAYIAGFALGAVVMANWVEIEPYKDMIIEFFKTTNQAAKHIG